LNLSIIKRYTQLIAFPALNMTLLQQKTRSGSI
jgi:hypothetical protein